MTEPIVPSPRRPRRRPLGKSHLVYEALLDTLRNGHDLTRAARIVGVSRATFLLWRKADPDFDRAVMLAKQDGIAKILADRLRGA